MRGDIDVSIYTHHLTGCAIGLSEHSTKRKDVERRLRDDGWIIDRHGPGDHVQYRHPLRPGRVTIDTGVRDIPRGTLRSVYRQAGWDW